MPHLFLWATLACALAAMVSAFLVSSGHSPFLVTPWMALVFLGFAAYLLAAGLQVRKYKRGERTNLTALGAARTAMLARTCAILGSVFCGLLVGVALIGLMRLWAPATAASAVGAGVAAAGALVMAVIAVVVERWCLDQSDDKDQDASRKDPKSGQPVAGSAARGKVSQNDQGARR